MDGILPAHMLVKFWYTLTLLDRMEDRYRVSAPYSLVIRRRWSAIVFCSVSFR